MLFLTLLSSFRALISSLVANLIFSSCLHLLSCIIQFSLKIVARGTLKVKKQKILYCHQLLYSHSIAIYFTEANISNPSYTKPCMMWCPTSSLETLPITLLGIPGYFCFLESIFVVCALGQGMVFPLPGGLLWLFSTSPR